LTGQFAPVPTPYHPPVKRSVEIAGHKTSISLEPLFWELLREAAAREGVPINALVARIDAERIRAATPPGLAGAIRLWLVSGLPRKSGPEHDVPPRSPRDPGP
jgi:predicted DNA-binding ribbon-helix-helix protein